MSDENARRAREQVDRIVHPEVSRQIDRDGASRPAVIYPGVTAQLWHRGTSGERVELRGDEPSLRAAGFLIDADGVPKPRGTGWTCDDERAGKITRTFDGTLTLRLDAWLATERDLAFRRFLATSMSTPVQARRPRKSPG